MNSEIKESGSCKLFSVTVDLKMWRLCTIDLPFSPFISIGTHNFSSFWNIWSALFKPIKHYCKRITCPVSLLGPSTEWHTHELFLLYCKNGKIDVLFGIGTSKNCPRQVCTVFHNWLISVPGLTVISVPGLTVTSVSHTNTGLKIHVQLHTNVNRLIQIYTKSFTENGRYTHVSVINTKKPALTSLLV